MSKEHMVDSNQNNNKHNNSIGMLKIVTINYHFLERDSFTQKLIEFEMHL